MAFWKTKYCSMPLLTKFPMDKSSSTKKVGIRPGTVICQILRKRPAPSVSAAS
ncbi:hypothetical protein D3C73_1505500 [compost metagenome]